MADSDDDKLRSGDPEISTSTEGDPPSLGLDLGDEPKAAEGGYQVLARKYRPRVFRDLIGQEAMVRTLTNAFEMDRIAHAFMLTGVRGVGKTTTARILARALNFEPKEGGPGGPTVDLNIEGVHCAAIMESRHVDVMEMDAASRTGIDDIREIIESVRYLPVSARYKVYIIDEVHMLSKAAFNGLLKTLEEPPPHVKFIFATTEIRKVPVTVLSRCQRFDLKRLTVEDLAGLIGRVSDAEKVALEPPAVRLISQAAEGSARDALSLLDRAISYGAGDDGSAVKEEAVRDMLGLADRSRIFDLFDFVMKGETAAALAELRAQYDAGADPLVVVSDLAELVHWLTRLKLVEEAEDDLAVPETERLRGREMAEALPIRVLSRTWQMLLKGIEEVERAHSPVAAAEMLLVRLAYVADGPGPEELVERLKGQSEGPGAAGSPAPSGGGSGARAHLSAVPASAPRRAVPQADAIADPQDAMVTSLATFEAMLALIAEKRDIKLKRILESEVSLVRFEPGRLEIALTGGADGSFIGDLSEKLRRWTGERWVVSLSKAAGAPTLREQAEARAKELEADALNDPLVKAVLETFPGAEIVEVRERPALGTSADGEESDLLLDHGGGFDDMDDEDL